MSNQSAFMDNLRQLFAECDLDQSGSLGRDEFRELCRRIGLNMAAAKETFERLDTDKNEQITFDEFVAGFQQYHKQQASPQVEQQAEQNHHHHHQPQQQQQQTSGPPSPRTSRARPASRAATNRETASRSPAARVRARVSQSSNVPSAAASLSLGTTTNGNSPTNFDSRTPPRFRSSVLQYNTSTNSSNASNQSSPSMVASLSSNHLTNLDTNDLGTPFASLQDSPTGMGAAIGVLDGGGGGGGGSNVVAYSGGELINDQAYNEQASCSGQFGSMLSTTSSSNNYSQMKTMQDLLECVQKLQNENQILTQIFFKDKREREEYISQLGEEFDQQLKEVEERANRRAREELENEKKRLREMMQTERETLQHHYETLEKISKLVKSPNGSSASGEHLDANGAIVNSGESLERVKNQLEDTFSENRQLKRSLLDTKTDVAMIWKEMEKLKKQYEEKLSSAYEKHKQTKSECDHIKQQLSLMKDSNRRLQDASDVITHYITDKVEPVIKVASGCNLNDGDHFSAQNSIEQQQQILNEKLRANSAANSRRGSILSDYLNGEPDDLEATSTVSDPQRQQADGREKDNSRLKVPTSSRVPANLSSGGQQRASLTSDAAERRGQNGRDISKMAPADDDSSSGSSINVKKPNIQDAQRGKQQLLGDGKLDPGKKQSSMRNFGKNVIFGARSQLTPRVPDSNEHESLKKSPLSTPASKSAEIKSHENTKSTTSVDSPHEELIIEPADGPSKATFNIILVGDSFVGKSSFAARFIDGSFVQGIISNCSIDFKTKAYKVDGINYTVNLWDTA